MFKQVSEPRESPIPRLATLHGVYALLFAYLAVTLASFLLGVLNTRHLRRHGHEVPAELASSIDRDRLERISDYTLERNRVALVSSLVSSGLTLLFVFGGLLESYDAFIARHVDSFVGRGVLFFLGLGAAQGLVALPFRLYANFRVEARYGFNRMSWALWWSDFAKALLLSVVFTAAVASAGLWLVQAAPETWWLWVWAGFVVLSVLLTYIAPYVIEPLFFKMQPLTGDGLADEVRALAERAGVHVSRVLTMDASRRSAHSNAYFTGIGRVKRVVLFDTLLAQLSPSEVLSVLAHELGHWRKHHIAQRLTLAYALAFLLALVAFYAARSDAFPSLIGAKELSFPARLVVLSVIGSIVSFFVTPLGSWWSRRHEREADRFASELAGAPTDLASALVKLARENLSNLHPHPVYAAFYYSHPPIVERVRALLHGAHPSLAGR